MIDQNIAAGSKVRELRGFLFLTVIMIPSIAVAVVFGYGLLIWMYQLVQGPPTY
jgi:nitrate reductase NapE